MTAPTTYEENEHRKAHGLPPNGEPPEYDEDGVSKEYSSIAAMAELHVVAMALDALATSPEDIDTEVAEAMARIVRRSVRRIDDELRP